MFTSSVPCSTIMGHFLHINDGRLVDGGKYLLYGLRRAQRTVEDSTAFHEALVIWKRVVRDRNNTPRAVKRFTSRVRYFAMLQASDAPGWRTKPAATTTTPPITEPLLVALSAVHGACQNTPQENQWETVWHALQKTEKGDTMAMCAKLNGIGITTMNDNGVNRTFG